MIIDKLEQNFRKRISYHATMLSSEDIQQKAKNNTKDNFKFAFEKTFMDFVIDRMGSNEQFFMRILENEEFKHFIMKI